MRNLKLIIKKPAKSRRQDRFSEIDDGKLKDLKQVDRLSHMFDEQDGGMLDYYDLSNDRGKRNKKKNNNKNEKEKVSKNIPINRNYNSRNYYC